MIQTVLNKLPLHPLGFITKAATRDKGAKIEYLIYNEVLGTVQHISSTRLSPLYLNEILPMPFWKSLSTREEFNGCNREAFLQHIHDGCFLFGRVNPGVVSLYERLTLKMLDLTPFDYHALCTFFVLNIRSGRFKKYESDHVVYPLSGYEDLDALEHISPSIKIKDKTFSIPNRVSDLIFDTLDKKLRIN